MLCVAVGAEACGKPQMAGAGSLEQQHASLELRVLLLSGLIRRRHKPCECLQCVRAAGVQGFWVETQKGNRVQITLFWGLLLMSWLCYACSNSRGVSWLSCSMDDMVPARLLHVVLAPC